MEVQTYKRELITPLMEKFGFIPYEFCKDVWVDLRELNDAITESIEALAKSRLPKGQMDLFEN